MDRDTVSALTHAGVPFANPLDPAAAGAACARWSHSDGRDTPGLSLLTLRR